MFVHQTLFKIQDKLLDHEMLVIVIYTDFEVKLQVIQTHI